MLGMKGPGQCNITICRAPWCQMLARCWLNDRNSAQACDSSEIGLLSQHGTHTDQAQWDLWAGWLQIAAHAVHVLLTVLVPSNQEGFAEAGGSVPASRQLPDGHHLCS